MPRITKVYTKTGDDGTTGLVGARRVAKSSLRVAVYGTVDELSSAIGAALAVPVAERLKAPLERIQNELFHLGAELATAPGDEAPAGPRIEPRHTRALETEIDALSEDLEPLANFILPGGTMAAAQLHLARAVCRRAERELVALATEESVGGETIPYLNRLSDALFVMARWENKRSGRTDVLWNSYA